MEWRSVTSCPNVLVISSIRYVQSCAKVREFSESVVVSIPEGHFVKPNPSWRMSLQQYQKLTSKFQRNRVIVDVSSHPLFSHLVTPPGIINKSQSTQSIPTSLPTDLPTFLLTYHNRAGPAFGCEMIGAGNTGTIEHIYPSLMDRYRKILIFKLWV